MGGDRAAHRHRGRRIAQRIRETCNREHESIGMAFSRSKIRADIVPEGY